MSKKILTDQQLIHLCLSSIEKKLNWGDCEKWRHRDFVKLSDIIEDKTKVRISVTTLKRIWGKVSYSGNIGPATLDALTIFIGYKDWIDYRIKMNDENISSNLKDASVFLKPTSTIKIKKQFSISRKWKLSIFAVSILLIMIVLYGLFFPSSKKTTLEYSFDCINPKGEVPYSVKFKYDVSKIPSDSIFIIAGDLNNQRLISKTDSFLTRFYFVPGLKKTFLMVENKKIDSLILFAYTPKWISMVTSKNTGHPLYFKEEQFVKTTFAHVNKGDIYQLKQLKESDYFVNFYYAKHFNVDGDNFTLKTRVKNNINDGADVCQRTNISVNCEKGYMTIPLINKGCLALAKIFVSDIFINGWSTDLSSLACDLDNWQDFEMKVVDKKVKIYINNALKFETQYNQELGDIYGFRIEFHGCGSLDYLTLFNSHDESVYFEDFGGVTPN